MNELHLFAGAGGGILGGILLGHRTVCAVEIEPYCREILLQRQRDGILPWFPIWDDIRTFDGNPWKGIADVVCGGFPCQDISCAGKGKGLKGERSGLWSEMARVISEVRPKYVFVENSPMLTIRGIDIVLGDLATLGYDARWGVVGAFNAGAPHKRERIWLLAYSNKDHRAETILSGYRGGAREVSQRAIEIQSRCYTGVQGWWRSKPDVCCVANGLAYDMDELKALGNGQVPAVVALAWKILSETSQLNMFHKK